MCCVHRPTTHNEYYHSASQIGAKKKRHENVGRGSRDGEGGGRERGLRRIKYIKCMFLLPKVNANIIRCKHVLTKNT